MPARYSRSAGFTLVEVLVASVILALAVTGIAFAVSSSHALTYEALHNERATALAEALLEEILSLPYADPQGGTTIGPDAGEGARSTFDNADDYHGYSESAGAAVDQAGSAYPTRYDVFSRSVSVVSASETVTGFSQAIVGITVTVTVQDDHGRSWVLSRFIAEPVT